ncbi:MAG: hypothetical protein ABMB14_37680, partial [Myxococcota bacterium]
MTVRFGCPACGRRYQVGRALDAYGALVDCPGCDHQFLLFPTADQRSGPEPQIDERFLTRLGEAASGAMSSPADTPLDDEPSDIEVTAHTAIARGARPSAAPTLP